MLPHTQNQILQASSHYACKQCKWWFRNRSGLTQHTRAKHPRFLPLPAISNTPPDASDVPGDHEMDGDYFVNAEPGPSNHEIDRDYSVDTEPGHNTIKSAFVGPGDTLFRNYHPGLTG